MSVFANRLGSGGPFLVIADVLRSESLVVRDVSVKLTCSDTLFVPSKDRRETVLSLRGHQAES